MMDLDFAWTLPSAYGTPALASLLSADAQVYLRCRECERETHVDSMFVTDGSGDLSRRFAGLHCSQCKRGSLEPVRHLEHRDYQCRDCGNSFSTKTAQFISDRCPRCSSNRLDLKSSQVVPPYPPRFDEFGIAKDNPWGVSASEDVQYIVQSTQPLNMLPDFPQYLLIDILFAERLERYGGYDESRAVDHLANLQGNLFRDYFRRTGEIPAGLKAIGLFETCVQRETDPVNRALMEHNVAMAIYSLLSRYDEDLIALLRHDRSIRQHGIAAAERALAVFDGLAKGGRAEGAGRHLDRSSVMSQCARIEHLLGDLLKVGNATDSECERAVGYLTKALNRGGLDGRLQAGVRESRATAVSSMCNPSQALVDNAINDYETAIRNDEQGRAWSEKWVPLANLAMLYLQRGDLDKAVKHADHSAALALHEIGMVTDEHTLQQKGRVYGHLFDRMAGILAKAKRSDDALALLESFRGIALRVHTRDAAAADAANKAAAEALSESWLGQLLGTGPTHRAVKGLTLEPVLPRIRPLLDHVKSANTALISLSIANGMATALVVTGERTLDLLQWSVDGTSLSVVEQYFNLETGSAREPQLAKLCTQGYRTLLQPTEKLLVQRGITRVGITANGLIGQLPFEAFSRDKTFFYLPSLAVGSDLSSRAGTRGNGSLLVVGYGGADLEATLEEVDELRRLFADRITTVDTRQMSKADILTKLQGDYDYIHFTCHGSFDPLVPLDSALHLKQDPASDKDRITARDLLGVRLKRTPVVSLSACSTALVAVDVSNSFAGLTGSFLRSGARCVIGSRWPVYDDAAMLFMTTLYSGLRRNSSDIFECFAAAQRARRDTSGIEDWAAFSFVGLP